MAKIVLLCFVLLLPACATRDGFFIYNDTNKEVTVTVTFAVENPGNGDTFILQPKKDEMWMYDHSIFEPNTFHPTIGHIKVVVDNKCKVELNRSDLEDIVKKDGGPWKLNITKMLLNTCK